MGASDQQSWIKAHLIAVSHLTKNDLYEVLFHLWSHRSGNHRTPNRRVLYELLGLILSLGMCGWIIFIFIHDHEPISAAICPAILLVTFVTTITSVSIYRFIRANRFKKAFPGELEKYWSRFKDLSAIDLSRSPCGIGVRSKNHADFVLWKDIYWMHVIADKTIWYARTQQGVLIWVHRRELPTLESFEYFADWAFEMRNQSQTRLCLADLGLPVRDWVARTFEGWTRSNSAKNGRSRG